MKQKSYITTKMQWWWLLLKATVTEWSYIRNYNDGTAAVVATLHTHDTESCIITGTAAVVAT